MTVISDVDEALKKLISSEAVNHADVEVVFDAPTKDWAARRSGPTIDVYLYDIREDLRRRERGMINEYRENIVVSRHLPPRYFKLSYLVAAWTQRPEDEHRLLASLLRCFLRYEALPQHVLSESLRGMGLPVPVSVALPPPEDRSFADVWTALGGELKPSLDVVVTTPIDTGRHFLAAAPVKFPPTLTLQGLADSAPPETRQRGLTETALGVSDEVGATDADPAQTDSARREYAGKRQAGQGQGQAGSEGVAGAAAAGDTSSASTASGSAASDMSIRMRKRRPNSGGPTK
ncbi:DUF4255 domain-containing protein [Mycolicibacterium sp. lyk4-40-TYG-92]|uniref:DUF4255 domain-containing protein n=1 Tax=Mycolicibacterium sp. lyk4-40-TYG-92 TaxID=3040295 RepID=UPI0025502661|nr:DUF4255 domain-containing protein [Mycolicibacterium sp. lyk4-40-TYG-92]